MRQKSRSPVPRRSTAARSPRWRTRCARPAAPVDLLIYRLQQWRVTADPVIVSSGRPVGGDHSKPAKITGHSWKTRLKPQQPTKPRDAGFPAMPWELEACTAIKQDTKIKTLFGIVRNNRST